MAIESTAAPPMPAATGPPESRGDARDGVRLLVAGDGGIEHVRFRDIGRFLRAGDLLVVNTSATLAAALDGVELRVEDPDRAHRRPVTVHFSTELDDRTWVVELRIATTAAAPLLDAAAGARITLAAGATLTLLEPYRTPAHPPGRGTRLWRARADVPGGDVAALLAAKGRPIRYGHVPRVWPLSSYQTVFGVHPGSAEMPSAGRPFTAGLVGELLARGITIAPVLLHAGVSSLEAGESPYPERFTVPDTTAGLIEATRRTGGRVLAVGTTVVRALESAAAADGSVAAASGWTDLVLGPARPARVVDGLVSGWHDAGSSHLLLLESVIGRELVDAAYAAAASNGYCGHEFGDACLLWRPAAPRRDGSVTGGMAGPGSDA